MSGLIIPMLSNLGLILLSYVENNNQWCFPSDMTDLWLKDKPGNHEIWGSFGWRILNLNCHYVVEIEERSACQMHDP